MISYNHLIFLLKDCSHTELVANGVCNHESNNAECNSDGGDCTTNTTTTTQATTTGGCNTGWISVMDIVMTSIITWTAAMMVETVVDVMSKQHTVRYVDALIQMGAGVAQHAHKQQQAQQQA